MLEIVSLAVILGLSAGFSPGPLLTVVISETLQGGFWSGCKVAMAPIITDLPIILIALFIIGRISNSSMVLAGISFFGALFVANLGVKNIQTQGMEISHQRENKSFINGIITNLLSPHPYLFWLTVGVPIMSRAMKQSPLLVILFLLIFYFLLVGSKIVLALIVDKSRSFLAGRAYAIIMKILGGLLCLLALFLFWEGIKLMSR